MRALLHPLPPSKSFYAHEGPSKTDFVVPIVPKFGSETAEVCRNFSCRTVWISEAGWMIHSYFIAEVQLWHVMVWFGNHCFFLNIFKSIYISQIWWKKKIGSIWFVPPQTWTFPRKNHRKSIGKAAIAQAWMGRSSDSHTWLRMVGPESVDFGRWKFDIRSLR